MNRVVSMLVGAVLCATPAVFAQGNPGKDKPESKDVTISGTLTMRVGTVPESLGPNNHMISLYTTNNIVEVNKGGKKMIVYLLDTTDGAKGIIESEVADAAPVKLGDFLNASVTIVGTGTESGEMKYKRIHFDKITSITRNAAAAQPAALTQSNSGKDQQWGDYENRNLTVSGILNMQTRTLVTMPGTNRKALVAGGTNATTGANTNGEQITFFTVITTNGSRVSFGSKVADASPIKLSDYLNASVTIVGTGMERTDKSGKVLIGFERITGITRNSAELQPILPAQTNSAESHHWGKYESTNLTVSGTLTKGTAALVPASGTNKSGEPFTIYTLFTTDGTKVIVRGKVADAALVKFDDYLNASVTIAGTGTEMNYTLGKRIIFDKVTSITRNAAAQPATTTP